jgi:DNA mismatch repair ATPase MutS
LGLQLLLLWDVRVLEWLEGWKERHADQVPHWIDAVAQLEALASAATIADENPEWGFPNWSSGLDRDLSVEQLAHPLVPEPIRVANDLKMEEARPLLLVTGSNMAGKSTLLRSLGINVALSRVGAPAACRVWSGPNYDLASSIRVQDSLQDGVSFFMAELKRLKSVVDRAHEEHVEEGMPMLVLLDEILQGTNSRERQIAVQSVLQQLVELGCTVVASTHDLDLAQNDFITKTAQIVHFREYFENRDGVEVMRFDYKMRPGVTPTTNALKLLALVGLQRYDHLSRTTSS